MKTRGAGFVVCCVLGFFPGLKSLAQEAATAPESSLASLSQKLLYSEISAYLQDGSALVGFLAGIEPDALIVRKDGQDIKVPRWNLKKIVLETEINFNRNMLYGMVAGLYAGNIVLLHEFSQPFAFAKRLEENEPWLGFIYDSGIWRRCSNEEKRPLISARAGRREPPPGKGFWVLSPVQPGRRKPISQSTPAPCIPA
jgi:hypothetical protein